MRFGVQLPLFKCTALAVIFTALLSTTALAQGSAGYWYESYRDGLAAWQSGDWDRAETKLKDALAKRPEQGRNIPVPGRRIDYLPEYYLGLVHVRQRRFQDATVLLLKTEASFLITKSDPEFKGLREAIDQSRRGNLEGFKTRTVRIDAVRADGDSETGTGIIVRVGDEGVDIVTALHVLMASDGGSEAPRSIAVSFYAEENRASLGPFAGEWRDKFNTDVDLAAIRVKPPRDVVARAAAWDYRETPLSKQEAVFTVGHAVEDYGVSETNVVLNPTEPDPRHFVISAAAIGERASGGPVIDSRGYLAGLMVLLDPRAGRVVAVHVNEVLFWLARWDVPAQPSGRRQ